MLLFISHVYFKYFLFVFNMLLTFFLIFLFFSIIFCRMTNVNTSGTFGKNPLEKNNWGKGGTNQHKVPCLLGVAYLSCTFCGVFHCKYANHCVVSDQGVDLEQRCQHHITKQLHVIHFSHTNVHTFNYDEIKHKQTLGRWEKRWGLGTNEIPSQTWSFCQTLRNKWWRQATSSPGVSTPPPSLSTTSCICKCGDPVEAPERHMRSGRGGRHTTTRGIYHLSRTALWAKCLCIHASCVCTRSWWRRSLKWRGEMSWESTFPNSIL